MNEEAIKDAYQLFVNNGYSKSVEEFKVLMRENENARKDMFDLFVSEGYKKKPEDFNLLMGVGQVKKKSQFKGYFSRGRYGFTYRTSGGRTYLCGIFCSGK